jgi:hypothetical protein
MTTISADVVVVGSGVAGALVADRLQRSGRKVTILEAGPTIDRDQLSKCSALRPPRSPNRRIRTPLGRLTRPSSRSVSPAPAISSKTDLTPSVPRMNGSWEAPLGTGWARRRACCRRTSRCTPCSASGSTGRSPTTTWSRGTSRRSARSVSRATTTTRKAHREAPVPDAGSSHFLLGQDCQPGGEPDWAHSGVDAACAQHRDLQRPPPLCRELELHPDLPHRCEYDALIHLDRARENGAKLIANAVVWDVLLNTNGTARGVVYRKPDKTDPCWLPVRRRTPDGHYPDGN